jgi:hypothetical protein
MNRIILISFLAVLLNSCSSATTDPIILTQTAISQTQVSIEQTQAALGISVTQTAIVHEQIRLETAVVATLVEYSAQSPLEIEPYPGAQRLEGQLTRADNIRSIYFHVSDATADEVAIYYQQKLDEFYGNTSSDQNREQCERNPRFENFPEFDEGVPGIVPFEYKCMFDRSGLNISQYTQVTIQPGIEATGTEGMVVIEYTQYWTP